MKFTHRRQAVAFMGVALLVGCASTPSPDHGPGRLNVVYSTQFIDGSSLNETPTEVRLVRRETTTRAVAGQIGVNLLSLALGGGIGFHGFSKESLRGGRIEDVQNREHLQNPVSTAFVAQLQEAVNARMTQEPTWQDKPFRRPLVVGGGSARLIYDKLAGADAPNYYLSLDLDVYKQGENSWLRPAVLVACSAGSAPTRPLGEWAKDDYRQVQTDLSQMLERCQQKVLADMPRLLGD